jgi:antirestriction protein
MKELSERQKKLEKIVNEIDDNYGIGVGYVTSETDVDEFIKNFKQELLIEHDFSDILEEINESYSKSYMELIDAI